jgi:hypothetical protein
VTFSEEMAAVANELLTEFGFAITVRGKSPPTYNPATLTATESNTSTPGVACFFDPSNSNLTGYEKSLGADTVLSGKWMLVYTTATLKTGDVIEAGSRKFKIKASTDIGPNGSVIVRRVATQEIS